MTCNWTGTGFLHCAVPVPSRPPLKGMPDYCTERKNTASLPTSLRDRSAYEWGCLNGEPVTLGRREIDTRGFLTAEWRTVPRGIPFRDPFSHCRAYDTDDDGAARYYRHPSTSIGPALFPDPFGLFGGVGGWTWRCADGGVFVCGFGNNLPCWKASTNADPSPGLEKFCSEAIGRTPPGVQPPGSLTVSSAYSWRCENGVPIGTPRNDLDARGYFTTLWTRVADPGAPYYDDPFAYCAAAGTVKPVDARYVGEQYPGGVGQKFWWCEGGAVVADGVRLVGPSPTPAAPR